eukprot:Gb_05555 [translate_table: standard]
MKYLMLEGLALVSPVPKSDETILNLEEDSVSQEDDIPLAKTKEGGGMKRHSMFKGGSVSLKAINGGRPVCLFGVHWPLRPFYRWCAPGLNWLGRVSDTVTLKKLECSKQSYALNTLAWNNAIGVWSYCVGLQDRISASHQLALTTSLPFVHTARRSYRLNDPVKCSDRADDGGSPPATSRELLLGLALVSPVPKSDETILNLEEDSVSQEDDIPLAKTKEGGGMKRHSMFKGGSVSLKAINGGRPVCLFGVHWPLRPFYRWCAPGLNWLAMRRFAFVASFLEGLWPFRPWKFEAITGSWDGPPSVIGRRYPPLANNYAVVIGSAVMQWIRPILLTRPGSRPAGKAHPSTQALDAKVVRLSSIVPCPLRWLRKGSGMWRAVGKVCPIPQSPNRVVQVHFGPPVSPIRRPRRIELKQSDVTAGRADGTGLHVLLIFPLGTSVIWKVSFGLCSAVAPWHGEKALSS